MRNYLSFRYIAAAFCGACAVLFLTINSGILARGAARWAVSEWDKLSYMAIAGTVPWIIALMPFLVAVTWRRGRWLSRPTIWTVVIASVWLIFVGYNILGAGGAVNFTRTDVVATRKFEASRAQDASHERGRLVALRDAIPRETRPAALLAPLLAAEKGKREWEWSDGCKEPAAATRRFCASYAKLASELGAAEELARLNALIARLDDRTSVAGWAAEVVDPQAQFWSTWTGLPQERVAVLIPLATPVVLEIGSMVFLSFALLLAGFQGHRQIVFGNSEVPQVRLAPAAQGEAAGAETGVAVPVLPPPRFVQRDPIAAGRQLARWFFAECTRPAASGGLPEDQWYALYRAECAKSNDTPISVEEFRGLAQRVGAVPMSVDGQWFYTRVLPLVPREGVT